MSAKELLTLLTQMLDVELKEQSLKATEQFAIIREDPSIFPFLFEIIQTDVSPEIFVCCLKMLESLSRKSEIDQDSKAVLIVFLVQLSQQSQNKVILQCLEQYVMALSVQKFQETFQLLLEQCQSEEQITQICLFFIKRRVRTRSVWQSFDTCFDACLPVLTSQLEKKNDQAVQIFTYLFVAEPSASRNAVLSGVATAIISADFTVIQKLKFVESLLETNNRLNNVQQMRLVTPQVQEFQLLLRGLFQQLFQFVLDQLTPQQTEADLFWVFACLQFVVRSQFYAGLGSELHQQLLEAAVTILRQIFDSQVLEEDLQLLEQLSIDISRSDNHLFILNGANQKDQILVDQVILFIQKYYKAMSDAQLLQEVGQLLQAADNFYVDSVLLMSAYLALPPTEAEPLHEQLLAKFSAYLGQEATPAAVATALWAIGQLLLKNAPKDFLVSAICQLNQMLKQPRTQLEFYMLVTFQSTFFDHFKRNEFSHQFEGILETNLDLLLGLTSNFPFYPEVVDLCVTSCDVLSRIDPEAVSNVYAEFFKSYCAQTDAPELGQLTDLLAIFGKIFVYKEAEINADLYEVYFGVLEQSLHQLLVNFKPTDYDRVQKLAKSFVYLLTNMSTVEIFSDISDRLLELARQLLQFLVRHGDQQSYLIAELLFVMSDIFKLNENNELLGLLKPFFDQLFLEQQLDAFNGLGFLLRLCIANLVNEQVNLDDYLALFQFSTSLNTLDVTLEVFMSSVYLLIFNLSFSQNLLELDMFSELARYLPKHLQRLYTQSAFVNNFQQSFKSFCAKYGEYQELYVQFCSRNLVVCQQVVKDELELPNLPLFHVANKDVLQERYQCHYEYNEIEEFAQIFENLKLLSDDIRTVTMTQQ